MNKFLSMLGLAQRAGKLVSGEEQVIQTIQKRKAYLVLLASDASLNTAKKITDKCNFYHIPLNQDYERRTLGQAIGKKERVMIAVTDKGFADALMANSRP